MSQPRLHELLEKSFQLKELYPSLLTHEDFLTFLKAYSLNIPLEKFSRSFIHKSFSHEFQVAHQEQLEFLGDAVVQLIVTEELYRRYPLYPEGQLSKLRSALVNEKGLSTIARGLKLGELILLGKGEYQKKLYNQDVALADTFEALMANIYQHHGLNFTRDLFLGWMEAFLPEVFAGDFLEHFDSKSKLQELILSRFKKLPRYSSEALGQQFEIGLWINEELVLKGVFSSKKSGEKELARQYLDQHLDQPFIKKG